MAHSLGFRPLAYHPIRAMGMVRNISPLQIIHGLNGCSCSTCSDLTIKQKRFRATRPNQSTETVLKIHPLSDDLHPDSQSTNSPPPQYSEWDETNHAQSPTSTPSAASNRASTTSLTEEEARQTLETWIESSGWYQKDELEPVVGAPGIPTCALQLAERGQFGGNSYNTGTAFL